MSWWTAKPKLLLFLLLLFPCSASALSYRQLQEGLDYAVAQPDAGAFPKIHLLRVDLGKYRLKVLDARAMKAGALSVKEMAARSKALAAINANFFDGADRPLGLVIAESKTRNPAKAISWYAALLVKNGAATLQKISGTPETGQYDEAIQAGPRLVVAGRTPRLKPESSPKSAVGIDSQGRLVLIASEGSVEINALAKWLALSEQKGGAGLPNALNLDGGSSSQFFVKAGGLSLWLPGFANVPIALGIFKKVEPR